MVIQNKSTFENTWDEIQAAFLVALVSMSVLLTVYEVFRRLPKFSRIYDKRREYVPLRTPTKLMKCRTLNSRKKFFKDPALFEFLFFRFDDNYLAYAEIANGDKQVSEGETSQGNLEVIFESKEKRTPTNPSRWRSTLLKESYPVLSYFVKLLYVKLSELWKRRGIEKEKNDSTSDETDPQDNVFFPQKSFRANQNRTLSEEDEKLLRHIGVDSFCMIRFLRLGFEITFISFIFNLLILLPIYYTNEDPTDTVQIGNTTATLAVQGFFSLTINHLENESKKLWFPWVFGIFFYGYVLQRYYLEWIVFHQARLQFLADGDFDSEKIDDMESLRQFRNSCLVENIPREYRSDKALLEFFETMFPGQVVRAEIILNTNDLTKFIDQRQKHIIAYENIDARYRDALARYNSESERSRCKWLDCSFIKCCKSKKPSEPQIRMDGICCFGGKKEHALNFHLREIEKLNSKAKVELEDIKKKKRSMDDKNPKETKQTSMKQLMKDTTTFITKINWDQFYIQLMPKELDFITGNSKSDGMTQNAFVEFKTRTAKQSALNCNLTGRSSFVTTRPAPDPRDIIWENVVVSRKFISKREWFVSVGLLFGLIFWSALTGVITSIPQRIQFIERSFGSVLKGYLPVLIILIIMAILPSIFAFMGIKIIRFKSMSEVDKFVYNWNSRYRIMNLLVILFSNGFIGLMRNFRDKPDAAFYELGSQILNQSRYYINIVFAVTGQSLMIQLSQIDSVLFKFFLRFMHKKRYSQRFLDWIDEPKNFIFGRYGAEFTYVFMIAMMYGVTVPLTLGATMVYFYLATKVFTHQAVFVFVQPYEGGGKLMRLANRTIFTILYLSILVFSMVLSLKEAYVQSVSFLIIGAFFTIRTHRKIYQHFLKTSSSLPLLRARLFDTAYEESEIELRENPQKSRSTLRGVFLSDKQSPSMTDRSDPLRGGLRLKQSERESISEKIQLGMGAGYQPFTLVADGSDEESDQYLFRQPHLYENKWETKPRDYR